MLTFFMLDLTTAFPMETCPSPIMTIFLSLDTQRMVVPLILFPSSWYMRLKSGRAGEAAAAATPVLLVRAHAAGAQEEEEAREPREEDASKRDRSPSETARARCISLQPIYSREQRLSNEGKIQHVGMEKRDRKRSC